jgi:hypothetical protein
VEASKLNTDIGYWRGASFEEALKDRFKPITPKHLKALPILVAWGIWIARNTTLFWDDPRSPLRVVANCLSILDHFNQGERPG